MEAVAFGEGEDLLQGGQDVTRRLSGSAGLGHGLRDARHMDRLDVAQGFGGLGRGKPEAVNGFRGIGGMGGLVGLGNGQILFPGLVVGARIP